MNHKIIKIRDVYYNINTKEAELWYLLKNLLPNVYTIIFSIHIDKNIVPLVFHSKYERFNKIATEKVIISAIWSKETLYLSDKYGMIYIESNNKIPKYDNHPFVKKIKKSIEKIVRKSQRMARNRDSI